MVFAPCGAKVRLWWSGLERHGFDAAAAGQSFEWLARSLNSMLAKEVSRTWTERFKLRPWMPVLAVLGIAAPDVGFAGQTEPEMAIEEVVVTGSRIQRRNLVSASPVTQVDADELLFQGTTRVEDMVRTLPQVYSDQNTTQSNGATGTATLNLRNLGPERTLVLVNGRRLPAGSPVQGGIGADINQIPGALVRGVEVLTGGASATYGSDAVAGVVNFLMKDDFEGVRVDYQFSQYSHNNRSSRWQGIVEDAGYPAADGTRSDGDTSYVSLIIGGNFDSGRGNATAYATYRDIQPVWQRDRDYSSCALSDDTTFCIGSSTIPQGRFTNFGVGGPAVDYIVSGHEFVARQGETFNYGPLNYYQRPDEQYTLGGFARYEVSEIAQVYTELMFMDDRSVSQIAPSGAFFVTDTLSCANPLMSDQQFEAVCGAVGLTRDDVRDPFWIGRRNVEGGNRQHDLRHTSFRGVFGVRGDLSANWNYDTSLLYAEVSMENTYLNDLGTTKLRRALDAVRDPATGEIVCRSVVDGSDPNCVPWNVFQEGGVTQEVLDYIVLPLFARGTTDQVIASGFISGDLGDYGIRLPSADTGVAIVLGAEYRDESLDFNPDEGFQSGEGAGQGGATPPVSGGYSLFELFMEANVPLVEGKPFAEELNLDFGFRYSDYDYGVATETFGIRSGWAINHDVKLRASFQRAIRGANVGELFRPQGLNLFDMTGDPCGGPVTGGTTAEGRTFEECARSGVTEAQWGNVPHSPAGQYNYLQSGNTSLEPESADTWTAGIVLTPGALDGLTVTVDWYSMKIKKGISFLTPEFILNQCLDGNLSQCDNVRRGAPGDLWIGSVVASSGHIVAINDNLAIEEVVGFDVVVNHAFDLGEMGTMQVDNVLSLIDKWNKQELAGAPVEKCAGKWGFVCGYPTPDVRNKLRLIWTTPWDVTATLMWRFTSKVDDRNEAEIDLKAISYIDLSGIWNVTERVEVRAGINNLFDKAPPIVGNGAGPSINGNGNTFPGMYDALGRYWFLAGALTL